MLCRGKGASFFFLFGASDERWIEDVEKNLIKPKRKKAQKRRLNSSTNEAKAFLNFTLENTIHTVMILKESTRCAASKAIGIGCARRLSFLLAVFLDGSARFFSTFLLLRLLLLLLLSFQSSPSTRQRLASMPPSVEIGLGSPLYAPRTQSLPCQPFPNFASP